MQKVVIFGALSALFFLFTPASWGQDIGDVDRLRKDNELLKKENELLKKEIELLKKELQARPNAAQDAKSEGKKPRTREPIAVEAFGPRAAEIELVKCSRGKDPTLVTFKFALENFTREPIPLGGVKLLHCYAADGVEMEGKLTGEINRGITVHKGETTRFQVSYRGLDPDITEIPEIRMNMGPRATVYKVRFYRIKIETGNGSEKGESEKGEKGEERGAKKGDR
jgi:hypothetical protein